MQDFVPVFDRHERIALQFSGGKDSIAVLEMMRPFWNRLTVYWLNTGDPFPEVVELIAKVRALVPHFVEVQGDRDAVIAKHGLPTDVLPYSSTGTAHTMRLGDTVLLQDRFHCCAQSLMLPMHRKMEEDDITLIIRGQRNDERYRGHLQSGDTAAGREFLYPIEKWDAEQVFSYIEERGWEIPAYYKEGVAHSGDCMVCPAWLGDGRADYLRRRHPERYEEYRWKLAVVASAAQEAVNNLIDATNDAKIGGSDGVR